MSISLLAGRLLVDFNHLSICAQFGKGWRVVDSGLEHEKMMKHASFTLTIIGKSVNPPKPCLGLILFIETQKAYFLMTFKFTNIGFLSSFFGELDKKSINAFIISSAIFFCHSRYVFRDIFSRWLPKLNQQNQQINDILWIYLNLPEKKTVLNKWHL